MTEMGGFIFKLKLMEVDQVELLDKRGYLTICISLLKDGKIYLRRPEGIKDWFTLLQVNFTLSGAGSIIPANDLI